MRERFSAWLWRTNEDDSNRSLLFRFIPKIIAIVMRECRENLISLRASALTFTVILSLLPIVALGTAVLKGVGAGDDLRRAVYNYIDTLERAQAIIPGGEEATSAPPPPATTEDNRIQADGGSLKATATFSSHLRRAADTVFDYVEQTDFTALGAFGGLGLIYVVISVLSSIQVSLNTVWHAEEGRPLGRRILDFLALMLLLPLSVNLAFAVEASLQSPKIFGQVMKVLPMGGMRNLLLNVLPIIMVTGAFTVFYRFIPNARVRFLPALGGATLSGVGWFFVQAFYIKLQVGVARQNAIYGSFATLPLFAVWMYMGWLVFFTGAEVAFALQVWQSYLPREWTLSPMSRLTLAFEIIALVGKAFDARKLTNTHTLARQIRQPVAHIEDVVAILLVAGILRKVDEPSNGLVPGTSLANIDPAEVVGLVFGDKEKGLCENPLAEAALAAAREAVGGNITTNKENPYASRCLF